MIFKEPSKFIVISANSIKLGERWKTNNCIQSRTIASLSGEYSMVSRLSYRRLNIQIWFSITQMLDFYGTLPQCYSLWWKTESAQTETNSEFEQQFYLSIHGFSISFALLFSILCHNIGCFLDLKICPIRFYRDISIYSILNEIR